MTARVFPTARLFLTAGLLSLCVIGCSTESVELPVGDPAADDAAAADTTDPPDGGDAGHLADSHDPSDVSLDTDTDDIGDSDVGPPASGWTSRTLGAVGDLHRARYLPGLGFRLVGDGGTILKPLGVGWVREWTRNDVPALRDVTRGGDGLIYAVGDDGAWLVRSASGEWQPLTGVTGHLNGVAPMGAGVVAVGAAGLAVTGSATGLKYELNAGGADLRSVAVNPDEIGGGGEAFAVASDGTVWRRVVDEDGASWFDDEGAAATDGLRDVFALDASNVWLVGDGGQIRRYTGAWSQEVNADKAARDLWGVTGGADQVLAVGADGAFLGRTGDGEWKTAVDVKGPLLAERRYEGVAVGGGRMVACGEGGAIQSKTLPDGSWHDSASTPPGTLRGADSNGNELIAVGDGGLILRVHAEGFGALNAGVDTDLLGVAVAASGVFFAVGDDGLVLRGGAGAPIGVVPTPTQVPLHGVAWSNDHAVAVGHAGTLITLDGAGQAATFGYSGQSQDLLDIFESDQGLIAVGRSGALITLDGDDWAAITHPLPQVDLHAGAAGGGRNVVVGANGAILAWESGGVPKVVSQIPLAQYAAVHVNDAGEALLAGWAGRLDALDSGGSLTTRDSPTGAPLYGLGWVGGHLTLVGASPMVWTHPTGGQP